MDDNMNNDKKQNGRSYSNPVIKELFAKSGNRCAMYGCKSVFYGDKEDIGNNICHIEALNKGPRYNPNLTREQLNSIDNLILLCRNCHSKIDNPKYENKYTVEFLKKMKADHERNVRKQKKSNKNKSSYKQLKLELFECIAASIYEYMDRDIDGKDIRSTLRLIYDYDDDIRTLLYKILKSGTEENRDIEHIDINFKYLYDKYYTKYELSKFISMVDVLKKDKVIECNYNEGNWDRFGFNYDGFMYDMYDYPEYLVLNEKWTLKFKGEILAWIFLELKDQGESLEKALFKKQKFTALESLKKE